MLLIHYRKLKMDSNNVIEPISKYRIAQIDAIPKTIVESVTAIFFSIFFCFLVIVFI